jgi:biotin operon repressor
MAQSGRQKIKMARQRLVFCRLAIDLMRNVHTAYAPATESFGNRLETAFVGLCVVLGEIEGKPFSIAKIAAYMRMPRAKVMRRLSRLQSWGLVTKQGHRYYVEEKALNSLVGMRSYQQMRRILRTATDDLAVLDALPD